MHPNSNKFRVFSFREGSARLKYLISRLRTKMYVVFKFSYIFLFKIVNIIKKTYYRKLILTKISTQRLLVIFFFFVL